MPIGDKVFAMTETTAIREVDPKTLETGERLAYNDYMTIHTATAHPHILPGGEFLNMGSSFGKETCYNVIQVDSSGDFNVVFTNKSFVDMIIENENRGKVPSDKSEIPKLLSLFWANS